MVSPIACYSKKKTSLRTHILCCSNSDYDLLKRFKANPDLVIGLCRQNDCVQMMGFSVTLVKTLITQFGILNLDSKPTVRAVRGIISLTCVSHALCWKCPPGIVLVSHLNPPFLLSPNFHQLRRVLGVSTSGNWELHKIHKKITAMRYGNILFILLKIRMEKTISQYHQATLTLRYD